MIIMTMMIILMIKRQFYEKSRQGRKALNQGRRLLLIKWEPNHYDYYDHDDHFDDQMPL